MKARPWCALEATCDLQNEGGKIYLGLGAEAWGPAPLYHISCPKYPFRWAKRVQTLIQGYKTTKNQNNLLITDNITYKSIALLHTILQITAIIY